MEDPRLNAELLLSETLKVPRIKLYLDFEKPVDENELSSFRQLLKRRGEREPLQYILGFCWFFGMKFKVSPAVLIPRPETELLVEKCIELASGPGKIKLLEIGTGSGCISIAAASKLDCTVDAIDKSREALTIARENSESNGTAGRINFIERDILADMDNFDGYDIVLSNPPYIPLNEMKLLQQEIRDHEPAEALTDSADGLTFYRRLFELGMNTSSRLKMVLELGDGKKEIVTAILKDRQISSFEVFKDLKGTDRVLYIEFNQQKRLNIF